MDADAFPRLNQRELAEHLGVDVMRIERATRTGVITRGPDKLYPSAVAVREWLTYERSRNLTAKRRSELERQKARLARVKAELAERKLAVLDVGWVKTDDVVSSFHAVCVRLRAKFQASLSRITHGAYYAKSLEEATNRVRKVYEELLAELAALKAGPLEELQIVSAKEPEKENFPQ
jgi:Trp operon repressor